MKALAIFGVWWLTVAPPIASASPAVAPIQAELDPAVESGRRALQGRIGSRYPWYDREQDDIRAVKIPRRRSWSLNWSWLPSLGRVLEILAWTVGLVLLAALCWLLIKAYLNRENRAAGLSSQPSTATADAARVEALPFPVRRDTVDLLREARRYYEQGNFNEAVIYLFSHQLVELDRGQIIRLAKGKTNRQYLREVGRRSRESSLSIRRLLEQTMVAFEDVFFGNRQLEPARFEACWSRIDEFNTLVHREAP